MIYVSVEVNCRNWPIMEYIKGWYTGMAPLSSLSWRLEQAISIVKGQLDLSHILDDDPECPAGLFQDTIWKSQSE